MPTKFNWSVVSEAGARRDLTKQAFMLMENNNEQENQALVTLLEVSEKLGNHPLLSSSSIDFFYLTQLDKAPRVTLTEAAIIFNNKYALDKLINHLKHKTTLTPEQKQAVFLSTILPRCSS